MKPPPFDYVAPTALAEAAGLLRDNEFEAKLLAGGQSLLPLLNMRFARPRLVVDLARIDGLDYVEERDGALAIGAMTRQRTVELSALVAEKHPLLHAAMHYIAHPQNRNQGTIGGSLAHADPAAELPALAIALDGELTAEGTDGKRTIPAADFFVTYLTTSLEPSEILTEVRLPLLPRKAGWSFTELARRHGDFALVGVVAVVDLDMAGKCGDARVVLFGVAPTPFRARAAEQVLMGEKPSPALAAKAARSAADSIEDPHADVHATAEYRRELAAVLTRRALIEAAERAARA